MKQLDKQKVQGRLRTLNKLGAGEQELNEPCRRAERARRRVLGCKLANLMLVLAVAACLGLLTGGVVGRTMAFLAPPLSITSRLLLLGAAVVGLSCFFVARLLGSVDDEDPSSSAG